ncbi:MAG: hypothetical protein WCO56_11220 [Verrucomicrobiota bacterium]
MRVKYTCSGCSAQIEVNVDGKPSKVVCPHCQTESAVQAPIVSLKNPGINQPVQQETYQIRWRGRLAGPFPLEEIDNRLESGQIGLLTEIQVCGEWITLREFYQATSSSSAEASIEPHAEMQMSGAAGKDSEEPLSQSQHPQKSAGRFASKVYVVSGIALLLALLVGAVVFIDPWSGKSKKSVTTKPISSAATNESKLVVAIPTQTNESKAPIISAVNNTVATNAFTNSPTTNLITANNPPVLSNVFRVIKLPTKTVALPPLPENEPRTFHLKLDNNYVGKIVDVNDEGIVIKQMDGRFSIRLAWELFDSDLVEREPKVIAFRLAKIKAREAAEQARVAAAKAAAKAKRDQEENARAMAEYRAQREKLVEAGITRYGWKVVTRGYLKAWGGNVTIGEIFAVVAPSAIWTAGKLSDLEPERYTHYLVEARWVNDSGEVVNMQYLVTIDGSDFKLHGCFVSGKKMADIPFLQAVKNIYTKN